MTLHAQGQRAFWLVVISVGLAPCCAYCRSPNPPEVQALIGMMIPPATKQMQVLVDKKTGRLETREKKVSGDIPGFTPINGTLLSQDKNSYSLGFDEGFINRIPGFIVTKIYADLSLELIDVISLPPALVEWRLLKGKVVYVTDRYRLSPSCESKGSTSDLGVYVRVVGLVKPERGKSDCAHESAMVRRAWGISEDGHISEIETSGLKCHYITMNDC